MNNNTAADASRLLASGESLFSEGDTADCAYIIKSGELEISTHSEGEKIIICTLTSGEIVGEMGVIDSAPRTASATALSETQLIVVTRGQLTERIADADPILKLLIKILLDRYRSGLNSIKGQSIGDNPDESLISEKIVGEYVRHGIDKIRLEAELKEALARDQLEVYYQPLLETPGRKVAGFEALTRWHHPERGHISPFLFITLAEETNLIVPVGLYVFESACRTLAQFQAIADQQDDPRQLFMSINISGRQIADPSFIGKAAAITSAAGVNRGQVKLEITETLAMNLKLTKKWIQRAHELGFKVSLDDFGTGFSSLETLYQLDLDAAKIDQAFVRPLHLEPRSRELMRGIVGLMKGLGLQVVVEGIETIAELEFIAALDCHLAQGYLIGKPLPAGAAETLLKEGPSLKDHID